MLAQTRRHRQGQGPGPLRPQRRPVHAGQADLREEGHAAQDRPRRRRERLRGAGGSAGGSSNIREQRPATPRAAAGGDSNYQRSSTQTRLRRRQDRHPHAGRRGPGQQAQRRARRRQVRPGRTRSRSCSTAVEGAAGIDTQRGDVMSVSQVAFAKAPAEAPAAGPARPASLGYAKYAGVGLGLLAFLFFAMRQLHKRERDVARRADVAALRSRRRTTLADLEAGRTTVMAGGMPGPSATRVPTPRTSPSAIPSASPSTSAPGSGGLGDGDAARDAGVRRRRRAPAPVGPAAGPREGRRPARQPRPRARRRGVQAPQRRARSRPSRPQMAKTLRRSPGPSDGAVWTELVETVMAEAYVAEGGVEYARAVLEQPRSAPSAPSEIIGRLSRDDRAPPVRVPAPLPARADLTPSCADEAPQTIALVIANLHTKLARRVLAQLPSDAQADVALRIGTMGEINPDVIARRRGASCARSSRTSSPRSSPSAGGVRVARRRSSTTPAGRPSATCSTRLAARDSELADEVRHAALHLRRRRQARRPQHPALLRTSTRRTSGSPCAASATTSGQDLHQHVRARRRDAPRGHGASSRPSAAASSRRPRAASWRPCAASRTPARSSPRAGGDEDQIHVMPTRFAQSDAAGAAGGRAVGGAGGRRPARRVDAARAEADATASRRAPGPGPGPRRRPSRRGPRPHGARRRGAGRRRRRSTPPARAPPTASRRAPWSSRFAVAEQITRRRRRRPARARPRRRPRRAAPPRRARAHRVLVHPDDLEPRARRRSAR